MRKKTLFIFLIASGLLQSCASYKALEVENLGTVGITKVTILDDSRFYGEHVTGALALKKQSKVAYRNKLTKPVVASIYDSIVAQLDTFCSCEIAPQLPRLKNKYIKDYKLPDYSKSQGIRSGNFDATVQLHFKMLGGQGAGRGHVTRTPKLRVRGVMYDREGKVIWRNQIKIKGKKLDEFRLGLGLVQIGVKEGMSMVEVQAFFKEAMVELLAEPEE